MAELSFLLVLGVIIFGYFLPTLIAGFRNKRNTIAILMLNLFLGWTVLGWIFALVWACTSETPSSPSDRRP